MGFGISDEVLEKIIMEPWLAPYRSPGNYSGAGSNGRSSTYIASNNVNHVRPTLNKASIITIANPTVKESENVQFLKSIISEIERIYTKDIYKQFRSIEMKQCFENIRSHFDVTCKELGIELNSNCTIPRNTKTMEYLFQGISEQVFFIITHENLTRKVLSNVITDMTKVMNEWELNKTGEKVEKKLFFAYYEERFDLVENEFRCCPYCGKVLYRGLHNCPNCLRIVISEKTQENNLNQADVDDRNKQVLSIQQEIENANDSVKELTERITLQQEKFEGEHDTLRKEIERLLAIVKEKDLAIEAYKELVNGISGKERVDRKVLVIGDNHLQRNEMEEICCSVNIPFDMLEFINDYTKIKGSLGKIIDSDKYEAIVIGAVPHKAKGIGKSSSPVEALKKKFYVVEAKTLGGELKITHDTLRRSLASVYNHMFLRGML